MIHSTKTASPFVTTNGDATAADVASVPSTGHDTDRLTVAAVSPASDDALSRVCTWLVEALTVIGHWLSGRAALLLAAATTYIFFYPMLRNRAENAGILYTLYISSAEGQSKIVWDYFGSDYDGYPDSKGRREIDLLEKQGAKFVDVTMDWWRSHPEIDKVNETLAKIVREP